MAQAYQPGDRLDGRYTLKDILGSGGAGVVFRAEVDATKKPVLIKIQEDRRSEVQQAILQREIDALRRLNHPQIAQLLDVRHTDDGKLFLCREFVEGVTLRELLQAQGALSAGVARDILLDITDALAYAHERDVIFRDLKPENVIVNHKGSTYNAKLVDFGAFGNLQEDSGQTRTGQFVGTPIYMSPEQVRGLPQTARTDIYGVGMLGYEMLYGRPPERPTETVFSLLTAIVTKDVEFPDLLEVPVPLLELVRVCLQRDAEKRPSSGDVLSRLRNINLNPRAVTLVEASRVSAGAAAAPAAQPMMFPSALHLRNHNGREKLPYLLLHHR